MTRPWSPCALPVSGGEPLGEVVGYAQGVGDGGEGGVHRADAGEEAGVHDVEVVQFVGLAVDVQDRGGRVGAEPAGARLMRAPRDRDAHVHVEVLAQDVVLGHPGVVGSQLPVSRGRKSPHSSSRILLPEPASACASVPPPAPVPTMITSKCSATTALLSGQGSPDSSSAASTSYSSAIATLGAAETTLPSPATGAIASSTSAISSLVAPAASARAVLHCRQTADDPSATDAATCSKPTVLPSRATGPLRCGPNPAPASPSSKIASLRRVS